MQFGIDRKLNAERKTIPEVNAIRQAEPDLPSANTVSIRSRLWEFRLE